MKKNSNSNKIRRAIESIVLQRLEERGWKVRRNFEFDVPKFTVEFNNNTNFILAKNVRLYEHEGNTVFALNETEVFEILDYAERKNYTCDVYILNSVKTKIMFADLAYLVATDKVNNVTFPIHDGEKIIVPLYKMLPFTWLTNAEMDEVGG